MDVFGHGNRDSEGRSHRPEQWLQIRKEKKKRTVRKYLNIRGQNRCDMKWMLGLIARRGKDTACIFRKQRTVQSARCGSLWPCALTILRTCSCLCFCGKTLQKIAGKKISLRHKLTIMFKLHPVVSAISYHSTPRDSFARKVFLFSIGDWTAVLVI